MERISPLHHHIITMESTQRPTPETDALHAKQGLTHAQYRDFARQLERERDEAREELEAMREAIEEVVRMLLSINLNDIFEDTMRNHAKLALAKLQPFLKP